MADVASEKPKLTQNQELAKQSEFQIGSVGHQLAGNAATGASTPPLDSAAIARIQRSPQNALRSDMLALQRTIGNRAVSALVRGENKNVSIQAKLEVGPVNDVYEREADHIARMVTSGIAQRKPVVKPRDEESEASSSTEGTAGASFNIKRMVQRKNDNSPSGVREDGSFSANSNVQERIRRMEQGGRPLPDSVRRQMEPQFGSDFSGVRIHTGGEAVQLSRDIGARAFTHGSHIAFNAGGFNPSSQSGRHLLAHELTHTIQQTGGSPLDSVQRKAQIQNKISGSTIQRGVWSSIKGWFSKKKPEPVVVSAPVVGTAQEIQTAALAKAQKAWDDAGTSIGSANTMADQKLTGYKDVDDEMSKAGETTKLNVGKDSVSSMKKGEPALRAFIAKFKNDLFEIRQKIGTNLALIVANGKNMEISNSGGGKKGLALQSHSLAMEAEELAQKMKADADRMGQSADTEVAFARSGMTGKTFGYDARSIAAAEKSTSDSVLELMDIQRKIHGYFLYLGTDFQVLQKYTMHQMEKVSDKYSKGAMFRTMGSAMARAESGGNPGMLTDEQAFAVGGESMMMQEPVEESEEEQEEQQSTPQMSTTGALRNVAAGRKEGEKALKESAQSSEKGGPKPKDVAETEKRSKSETKFAKRVKRLEIRYMLYVKAQKRLGLAKEYKDKTDVLYNEANKLYEHVDSLRSGEDQSRAKIDEATRAAGDAKAKVAQGTVYLERVRKFKQEVYNESQQYEKYVGKRAMSSTRRKLTKTRNIILGTGLKVITGGLLRIESQDTAGGYQVETKVVTLKEDIQRKKHELDQVLQGVNGNPVHGLGGANGAKAYVFFKNVSTALQIIRDISSAVALWVTILTGGVGAPVGAVFASLALLSGISKAAVDLLLLVWSGIGLGNTNDPRSRMVLRGENTRNGLAFGEGAFMITGAGLTMGLSGDTGALNFNQQMQVLQGGSYLEKAGNLGIGSGTSVVGGITQNVGVAAGSKYANHSAMTTKQYQSQIDKLRKVKVAIRAVTSPSRTAFTQLSEFAQQKKKEKKKSKNGGMLEIMSSLAKTIEDLGSTVEQVPEENQPVGQGA